MNMFNPRKTVVTIIASLVGVGALWSLSIQPALAGTTTYYQDLPTALANPINQSFHNATGPVIADDFNPRDNGLITTVEWWGSAATSSFWEVTFHNNDVAGQPAILEPFHGGLSQIFAATGVADNPLLPSIFHYTANFSAPWYVQAGTEYWFSVANTAPGWNWALAENGATIGSEIFNAHNSTGGIALDGGPHAGPWNDVHTDFAFRIQAIPEPETYAMLLAGLGLMVFIARRRRQFVAA